jgi:hypothetical protein
MLLERLYRQSSVCCVNEVTFLYVINDICAFVIALRIVIEIYQPH